jgi:dihydrofolate synthase / folylpolyglutamate synthase
MDYFHARRFLDTLNDWEKGPPPPGPIEHYLPRMRALLDCLGAPQQRYRSIIVGGTNGKGTTASLLASLLHQAGRRVGLYTSPHLHTQRERIQVDGRLFDRDRWAGAISHLYDHSRGFEQAGLGDFTRYEALTGLAAWIFAEEKVDIVVWEVGLGGRYDAANAWDSDLALLTSISLDHTDVLGNDLIEIAADKIDIARPQHPLFTTQAQEPEVLDFISTTCQQRGIDLHLAAPTQDTTPGHHSSTYTANAGLALAAAAHLLAADYDADQAQTLAAAHTWPGRFEQAGDTPFTLLDGAHNPAAAQILAADLGHIAPRWVFVVGASLGHDAAGVLEALAPLAAALVLTQADHAKSLDPENLATLVPPGPQVEIRPTVHAALETARQMAGVDGHLCVTGSLYVVAAARECLGLVTEGEGISEDVALESLVCVEAACRRLGLSCQPPSQSGTLLRIDAAGKPLYFWRNKHPFNDYVGARLAEDKAFQHELFSQAGLPLPTTMQLFNPMADDRFNRYKTHTSITAMVDDIESRFAYPLVIKKYRSSVSQGVFVEHNKEGLAHRLQVLFENSAFNDNIVLIQAWVDGPEYRVVASGDELLLAYTKEGGAIEGDSGKHRLNPLHHPGGRADKIADPALLRRLTDITARLSQVISLGFYAIDLLDGPDGLCILEINPNPFCYFYNRSNGREDFTTLYATLLRRHLEQPRK